MKQIEHSSQASPKVLITIVTVVLNGVNHLERAIQSVISQACESTEYIIIDGRSSDGTIEIIEKYESCLKRWVSEPDKGIFDAMNRGLQYAEGELVLFLNSDDWLLPNVLSQVSAAIVENPGYDVYHGGIRIDDDREIIAPHGRLPTSLPAYQPASFVRRSLLSGKAWFDITYKVASDFKFFKSLQLEGYKFLRLNFVVSNFSLGGASSNLEISLRETREVLIELGYSRIVIEILIIRLFLIYFKR
jgi:glycosyltransferase involved in cell wall biosynthesis